MAGAGWRLVDMHYEDEKNYEAKIVNWLQTAYEGQCDMHCNPHLFSLPCVAFGPAKRIDLQSDSLSFLIPVKSRLDVFDATVASRRNAFTISTTKAHVKDYSLLMNYKIDLPYIQATLWQRPKKKKIAWMLTVKNARIVKKLDTVRDIHSFYLVCQEISETMPKDLLPPPEYDSSLMKHLEKSL